MESILTKLAQGMAGGGPPAVGPQLERPLSDKAMPPSPQLFAQSARPMPQIPFNPSPAGAAGMGAGGLLGTLARGLTGGVASQAPAGGGAAASPAAAKPFLSTTPAPVGEAKTMPGPAWPSPAWPATAKPAAPAAPAAPSGAKASYDTYLGQVVLSLLRAKQAQELHVPSSVTGGMLGSAAGGAIGGLGGTGAGGYLGGSMGAALDDRLAGPDQSNKNRLRRMALILMGATPGAVLGGLGGGLAGSIGGGLAGGGIGAGIDALKR